MCDCLKTFNEGLEKHNGRVATGFQITETLGVRMRVLVATEKIDKTKRKPVPAVLASHCPFCGEKFE